MWFTFTHDKHAETVEFIVVRNKIIMKKTQVYEAYVVHIKFSSTPLVVEIKFRVEEHQKPKILQSCSKY